MPRYTRASVLAAIVGVVGALGGAFIGPFFQRKHERWVAKRADEQLLREKAQELFDELDRVAHAAAASTTRTLERLNKKDLEIIPFPDLGRIRAVAALYFPSTLPRIEQFETQYGEGLASIVSELRSKNDEGKADADYINGLIVVMMTQAQQIAAKFVREMRMLLTDKLPSFELLEEKK